ncbi:IS3 family transposase [Streptomyces sp. NPDC050759]|uniref:IS3 family transposase n=1 Tax=Streptomyces sp. NPDC050759 TaxID=3365635 RepID=UPI0037B16127
MEAFWARVQVELLNRGRWRTRLAMSTALFEYLEIFHNRQRRHSALGMLCPVEPVGSARTGGWAGRGRGAALNCARSVGQRRARGARRRRSWASSVAYLARSSFSLTMCLRRGISESGACPRALTQA